MGELRRKTGTALSTSYHLRDSSGDWEHLYGMLAEDDQLGFVPRGSFLQCPRWVGAVFVSLRMFSRPIIVHVTLRGAIRTLHNLIYRFQQAYVLLKRIPGLCKPQAHLSNNHTLRKKQHLFGDLYEFYTKMSVPVAEQVPVWWNVHGCRRESITVRFSEARRKSFVTQINHISFTGLETSHCFRRNIICDMETSPRSVQVLFSFLQLHSFFFTTRNCHERYNGHHNVPS